MEKKVKRPGRMVNAKRQLQNANFIDQLSKTNKPQSENRQKPNTHPHLEGKPKVTTLLQRGSTTLEGTAVSAATNKAQSENTQHLVTLSHQEGPPKVTTFSPSGSTTLRDSAVSRENTAPIHNDNKNLQKDIRLEDITANNQFPENNSPTKQYSETVAGDKARHPDHSAPLESSSEDNFEKKYPQSDVQPESSLNGNSEGKSHITDGSCDLPKSYREDNPSLKENNKNYQVHSFVGESTWTTIRTNTQLSPHASIKNASSPHSNYPQGRTSSGRAHVTGIPNLGNTCYANSVLQVLGKSPSLQSYLENCQKGSGSLLKKILTELNTPGTRCVYYEIVHSLLHSVFKREDSFSIGRQDDSHAFFLALINCVQADSDGNPCEIFEGMMTNLFKYNTCDHVEYSDEQRFTSLLMPIANQENLYACIKDFCSEETFEKNLLQCRMCEEKHLDTVAKKQLVFTKLPKILVLQMGRFEEYMDYRTKRIRKNIARIKFSNEIKLDEKCKSIPYDLYGVVNHHGSINGGHYTATVRLGNSWYRCSDTHVSTGANPTTNPNGDAYLLFYSRKEDVTMQQGMIFHPQIEDLT
ncbi:uncharacterized protein LOC117326816 [Pecten maximus]|uniref:uncharacterized protein LOC117326816 n=1 Tax=Pecten maximus TaxID=6579 RepID=UPI0014583A9E|nr:uncharacterized protein LOC117326816 [Pecten maximus]